MRSTRFQWECGRPCGSRRRRCPTRTVGEKQVTAGRPGRCRVRRFDAPATRDVACPEEDLASRGLKKPPTMAEDRALAGPVRPDEPEDLTLFTTASRGRPRRSRRQNAWCNLRLQDCGPCHCSSPERVELRRQVRTGATSGEIRPTTAVPRLLGPPRPRRGQTTARADVTAAGTGRERSQRAQEALRQEDDDEDD